MPFVRAPAHIRVAPVATDVLVTTAVVKSITQPSKTRVTTSQPATSTKQ